MRHLYPKERHKGRNNDIRNKGEHQVRISLFCPLHDPGQNIKEERSKKGGEPEKKEWFNQSPEYLGRKSSR